MKTNELEQAKAITVAALDLATRTDVVWIAAHSRAVPAWHRDENCSARGNGNGNAGGPAQTSRVITTRASAESAGAAACRQCAIPGVRGSL
jgi:hypothetical protein